MRVPKEKIDKVMETCRKLGELGQLRCLNCRRKLRFTHVRKYEHGEGYYWVYLQCPYCGYGTALWKLLKYINKR